MKLPGLFTTTAIRALAVFCLLTSVPVVSSEAETAPLWSEVASARLDGRSLVVDDLRIVRDAITIELVSGRLHFLSPLGGRDFGALFIGEGRWRLHPASSGEWRQLARHSGKRDFQELRDSFSEAILFFGEETYEELVLMAGSEMENAEVEAAVTQTYQSLLRNPDENLKAEIGLRLVRRLGNRVDFDESLFLVRVEGEEFPDAILSVDPSGTLDGEEVSLRVFEDSRWVFWYSSHRQEEIQAGEYDGLKLLVDPTKYDIETRIAGGVNLEARTRVRLRALRSGVRVLAFDLLPSLTLESAELLGADEEALSIPFFHGEAGSSVVLPEALQENEEIELRFRYRGDGILTDDGEGIFKVGARSSWYANFGGFHDLADFHLVYRVPARHQVISVGSLVEEHEEGSEAVSTWKTEYPVRVAGFNYGQFKSVEKTEEDTGTKITIHRSTGTPQIIREINELLRQDTYQSVRDVIAIGTTDTIYNLPATSGPTRISISPKKLTQGALADTINSVRVFSAIFGPLPSKEIAITQQADWFFGQSWPSLVYLPYLAAFNSSTRRQLGLAATGDFVDQVCIHEVSHQWWGHHVGFESYRDQWISEGFAEFSTALVLQMTGGWDAYGAFWKKQRRVVLENGHHNAGAVTLGQRLPAASYAPVVYGKGGFVLHMLRMLMRDTKAEKPDARFFAMMRDFVEQYGGRNASTEDFKRVVTLHMTPELNATRDGRIDWFFDQWVYGTRVPTHRAEITVEKQRGKTYRLHGTVSQSGVPEDFMALVPLYLEFADGQLVPLAQLPFKGEFTHRLDTTLELPKKPERVLVNAYSDVLAF